MPSPVPHPGRQFLVFLSILVYAIASLRSLQHYEKHLRNTLSTIEQLSRKWIRPILIALLLYAFAEPILDGILYLVDFHFPFQAIKLVATVLFLAVFGFFHLKRIDSPGTVLLDMERDFTGEENEGDEKEDRSVESGSTPELSEKKAYAKSGYRKETLEEVARRIEAIMEERKLYRNSEFSVSELSQELRITRHQISEAFSTILGINFYDYVNRLRVEEVLESLNDPEHRELPLLRIAFEAGFNSKSTFNRIFKSVVGETPSRYREKKGAGVA